MTLYCKDFFFRCCRKNSNSLCKQPDLTRLGHIKYMYWMCILQVDFCHSSAPQEQSATRQQVRKQFSTFPAAKPNLCPAFLDKKEQPSLCHYKPRCFTGQKQDCAGKGWREKTKRWGKSVKNLWEKKMVKKKVKSNTSRMTEEIKDVRSTHTCDDSFTSSLQAAHAAFHQLFLRWRITLRVRKSM